VSAKYGIKVVAKRRGDNSRELKELRFRAVNFESLQSVRIANGVRRQDANRSPLPMIWTVSLTRQPADVWKVAAAVNDAMKKPGGPQRRPGSAAGRAAKLKPPTKRQLLRMPNAPPTKVYTTVSLVLLVCLGLVFIYDFIQLVIVQHPDVTTQHFTVAILVSVDEWRHIRIASETVISETDLECQKRGPNAFWIRLMSILAAALSSVIILPKYSSAFYTTTPYELNIWYVERLSELQTFKKVQFWENCLQHKINFLSEGTFQWTDMKCIRTMYNV